VETLPVALDVRDRAAVEAVLGGLPERWAPVDILLNNAGLARGLGKVHEGLIDDWDEMIDTNVKGLLYVTRAILPGMVQRRRGHVINLGSIAGKEVYPNGAVYCASKVAVDFINRGLRLDLCGANVRVTSIDPGMVETEFSQVRFHGDQERAAKVYQGFQPLSAQDVADVILFCVTRPSHVNIQDVLLMSTAQASATMTYRESS
jgi:serine 3-dehydrogenase